MNAGVGISFSQSQSIRNECNLLYVCCWYFVCFIRSAKENVCNLQRNITIYTLVCWCYDMKAIHLYCFVPPNLVVCVSNQKLARASAMVSAPNGVRLGTIYLCGAIKTIRWTLQTVIRNKTTTSPNNRLARLDEIRLSLSNAENDQILPSFFSLCQTYDVQPSFVQRI